MKYEDLFKALMEGFHEEAAINGRLAVTRETEVFVSALARGLENVIAQVQAPNTETVAVEILRRLTQGKVVIQQPSKEEFAQWFKEFTSQS